MTAQRHTRISTIGLAGVPKSLVDSKGILFASGHGGVWIFNSSGKVLGKIKLNGPASNTTISRDEKTLFIINDGQIIRY